MEQHLTDYELIERYSKELKLSSIRDRVEDMVAAAATGEWDYRTFLRTVLHREVEQWYENRKYARIRKAGFPQLKYLHELVGEDLPPESRAFLPQAETLDFIREGRNIVMYGNPWNRQDAHRHRLGNQSLHGGLLRLLHDRTAPAHKNT